MMNKVQKSSLEDYTLVINTGLCHCEVEGKICFSHYAQSQGKKHITKRVKIILTDHSFNRNILTPKSQGTG